MDDNSTMQKKRKNPVKLDIQLNEEQKEAKALILTKDISIITGAAGKFPAIDVKLNGVKAKTNPSSGRNSL